MGSFGVWSSSLWNVHDRVFPPEFVCVCVWRLWGLIEICNSSTGCSGPLDECPWAPGLLSSLLGGWLSLGGVSSAGPCLGPLFMTVNLMSSNSTFAIQPTTLNFSRMCSKKITAFNRKTLGCLALLWLLALERAKWWKALHKLPCRICILLFQQMYGYSDNAHSCGLYRTTGRLMWAKTLTQTG